MNISFDVGGFFRDIVMMMLSWLLLAMSFFSWGRLLSYILDIKINGKKGIITTIWLGFVFCIFFFSFYHLFLPINVFASSFFYFGGIICFFINYGKKLNRFVKSINIINKFAILLTLFVIASIAIQQPTNFDTGYYHLNSIRWANEYHIIKGLGNLHSRLGFNQLFFLYSASLNFHPYLNNYAFHVSNSFLCALFFVGMFLNSSFIDLLILCLFFFIPMPFHWISSPTPDYASTILQIVVFRYFIEILYATTINNKEKLNLFIFIAILATILVFIKLNNGVFSLGLGLSSFILIKKYPLYIYEKRKIKKAFIFIGIFFLLWMVRGYIQTGYPFYPMTLGKINFIWTVPEEMVKLERNYIYTAARCCLKTFDINTAKLKDYLWFKNWFEENFFNSDYYINDNYLNNLYIIITLILFPFTINNWGFGTISLFVISILIFAFSIINYNRILKSDKSQIMFVLFNSEILYIIFWFFTAPDPRFTYGIFIIIFVNSLLLLKDFNYYDSIINNKIKKIIMFYPLFMFIWLFSIGYSNKEFFISKILILKKQPTREYITRFGLRVLVPARKDGILLDSDIPATPNTLEGLSLIGNDIKDGFCVKGKIKFKFSYD